MKKKSKLTKTLIAVSFLIGIIAIVTPVLAAGSNSILVMAKGDDADIPGNDFSYYNGTTLIVGKITFDEVSSEGLGRVEFHIKIYHNESGKKVYSIMGKLKNAEVFKNKEFVCTVRGVTWINLWFVTGVGMIKTTDAEDLEIIYRHKPITLPNTEGKWCPATVLMMVSPYGDFKIPIPDGGFFYGNAGFGWAYAGIMDFNGLEMFGGVTALTKYMEI
ncbi:MAG: hypothetical protein HWN80_00590 [Candidatus Lokiarchaeota archaeon]|nr:hypothetical protein [Candidatus Lokiarchaeota archaeon]